MYKTFRKILAIFLIPIVLFSTTSFRVDRHLCLDEVYSISLLGEAENCGMVMETFDENTINTCSIEDENCCADESQFISGSIVNLEKEGKITLELQQFITAFLLTNDNQFLIDSEKNNTFNLYIPPRVTKNYSILYQVFLI